MRLESYKQRLFLPNLSRTTCPTIKFCANTITITNILWTLPQGTDMVDKNHAEELNKTCKHTVQKYQYVSLACWKAVCVCIFLLPLSVRGKPGQTCLGDLGLSGVTRFAAGFSKHSQCTGELPRNS